MSATSTLMNISVTVIRDYHSMVRRLAVLIAVTSCGRVSFTPLGDTPRTDAPPIDVSATDVTLTDTPGTDAPPSDTAPACAAMPCTGAAAFVMCGTRCYATCNDPVDRATGLQRCMAWGGTLAIIP